MGRKAPMAKELLEKAAARGYQPGAHREKDIIKEIPKYVQKTLKDQNWALSRYVKWIEVTEIEGKEEGDDNKVERSKDGQQYGDLATTKDFLCFHIALSRGRIKDKTTVDSVKTFAEWFFAGFTRVTGTVISEDYRSAIYEWVKTVLTKECLVVNTRKPKHLFGKHDLIQFHITFWTKNDTNFVHPRNKIQIPFIIDVFCWTGARISAFFPNPDNKAKGGLRYKDIKVVLLCVPNSWKVIYRIDQRWVKNNRDPENITYGASTSQHMKLIFDDTQYLLALVFADEAFYGIKSPEKFWQLQIPEGEELLPLRWEDSVKNLPILRNATLENGVFKEPLPKATFERIVRFVMRISGYFGFATVHAIRRYVGKKLNERYTETERSQHITQNDPHVYGQSYVVNTSSCDGRRAFLDEAAQHDHVEYFQGFSKFREKGLPWTLPAEKEAALEKDQHLIELKNRVQNQRDWKIRTQGKEQAEDFMPTQLVQTLSMIMPERGRLTEMMISDKVISEPERKQAVIDLYLFITRDYTVLYRPGEEPIGGACPVNDCGKKMEGIHKDRRATHIHHCRQRKHAKALNRLQSELIYCFQCFTWFVKEEWSVHCRQHLNSTSSRGCRSISYCHTLIRPGYCPFCLGDETLSADERLQAWTRDTGLMAHLEKHISEAHWPSICPHPLCGIQLQDEMSFWYHLSDDHNLRRANKKGQKRRWEAVSSESNDSR
ncbi:MAG: hypothetical protein M1840_008501 [Geoglossum simile]|nr:MAG: hypothetical protein M1840_008501 [Geoglossum simile]